jgi:hypothetical protein
VYCWLLLQAVQDSLLELDVDVYLARHAVKSATGPVVLESHLSSVVSEEWKVC